jgi:translation elongation factor EF-G
MSVSYLRNRIVRFSDPGLVRHAVGRSLRSTSTTLDATDNPTNIPIPSKLISIEKNQEILKRIPLEDVRNFCFIAHVDHGKSSLSSRLLEITGNMGAESQQFALETAKRRLAGDSGDIHYHSNTKKAPKDDKEQIDLLDTLSVERERGITVKATTASMLYPHPSAKGPEGVLLLNMIDTPGHADFGREVARSLSFVQGAILLLDSAQGIQAQSK